MTEEEAERDQPLYTVRRDGDETVVTAHVELALPTGPMVLAVDFHVEYHHHDFGSPSGHAWFHGLVEWRGTITLDDIPRELWDALGSRVPIRTRAGSETHVLVSKIEPPRSGVGADLHPSVVTLEGSGPLPQFTIEQRGLPDSTMAI